VSTLPTITTKIKLPQTTKVRTADKTTEKISPKVKEILSTFPRVIKYTRRITRPMGIEVGLMKKKILPMMDREKDRRIMVIEKKGREAALKNQTPTE
jgi:hypothetical protein